MAIYFLDSANGGDVASRWLVGTPNGIQAGVSPSGRAAYEFIPTANLNECVYQYPTPVTQANAGFYFSLRDQLNNDFSANSQLFRFHGPTGTVHMAFTVDGSGAIHGRLGGGSGANQVQSANSVILLNTWHHVEVASQVADSGGRFIVWVDGVNVIDFTGDTRNGGSDTTIGQVRWGRTSVSGGESQISDIRIGDGLTQVGVTTVGMLLPDGAGNTTGLSQQPGTGSNFDKVDEATPNGNTDYVFSATEGNFDLYTLTNLLASPTGSWEVKAVQTTLNAQASDGGAKFIRPVLRSGGSNAVGASQVLPASYTSRMEVFENNPVTAAAWTEAEVNALEVGPEVRDS
jgi:hypothetical protein